MDGLGLEDRLAIGLVEPDADHVVGRAVGVDVGEVDLAATLRGVPDFAGAVAPLDKPAGGGGLSVGEGGLQGDGLTFPGFERGLKSDCGGEEKAGFEGFEAGPCVAEARLAAGAASWRRGG